MSKKKSERLTRPTERVAVNPVTGETEVTALDTPQKEFELIARFAAARMKDLSNADAVRVAAKLERWARNAQPHQDAA